MFRSAPLRFTTTSVTAVPVGFVLSLTTWALVSSVTFGYWSAGRTAEDFRVGFGMDEAGKPVAVHATHAGAERHVLLVEHDAAGRVKRMIAGPRQVVGQLLDARLVRHRRKGIRRARRRLGRVFATRAVHLIHLLGLGVVGLHLLVADGPGRRDAVVVLEFAEILFAQAVQRRAIHLGGAAHEVVDAGLKGLAVLVTPSVAGDIAVLDEHLFGAPVLGFALQPVAALEQQDALARRSQVTGQRAAAGAAADDDDVIVSIAHEILSK